ncbi:MAG: NAD(P)-dependent oxidoreductase [Bacteroidales bacterium]|nr:NAD(P)-dependent oxidoreductase [Bacteroidales bacterium]
MNKILLTGANGYLGARLVEELSKNNYSITALCYPNKPNNKQWEHKLDKIIVGDIRDEACIEELTNERFDVVIHLVSLDQHQSNQAPNRVAEVNVMPVWNLLEKFSTKNNLNKFIYFSTFQVYGKAPLEIITEDFIPFPQSNYGLTHLLSENICNYFNLKSDVNCINVRLSNSYGSPVFQDNNCWGLVINDLCKTVFLEKNIKLLSDGSPQRDFIHSSDVCNAIEVLVKTQVKNLQNNSYHISSGKTLTILEIAHYVKSVYEKRYNYDVNVILPGGEISVKNDTSSLVNEKYTVSISKLKELGFVPKTDLNKGINEIFDYLEMLHGTK